MEGVGFQQNTESGAYSRTPVSAGSVFVVLLVRNMKILKILKGKKLETCIFTMYYQNWPQVLFVVEEYIACSLVPSSGQFW